ncbi:arabinosyltransferase domain-containing protein [Nocardia sp. NPDC050406]|uniref:arabinosyltransferase domain-containing protein n=1 Tax=Nocardia sp. NPDC050406 TaxID=3364318 RepID=UPI00379152EC
MPPSGTAQPGTDPDQGTAARNGLAPKADPQSGTGCAALVVHSDANGTTAELTGLTRSDGSAYRTTVGKDVRPQIVGVYTDLDRAQLGAARLHAEVDSRFSSSPSALKLAAMVGAVLCTLVALLCLHRLDTFDGRRARRFLPALWWRVRLTDAVVGAILLLWHVIGANTSDDGYILTMARASKQAGYTANYYRWFGVAEAPFGWPYEVLALMTRVSDASLWMRLPSLLAGVLCWWVLSREVLPRLGSRVAAMATARWTAGLVFLAIWLPYNNGLRPEPFIALGALLTWCSIERAIATRRLLPAAVAVLIAAFSLAAGPSGLICLAALFVGSRQVVQTLVSRARAGRAALSGRQTAPRNPGGSLLNFGALVAPILAAGALVLVVVFADQTFASVVEATRVRKLIGPDLAWFEETTRWESLLSLTPDGSLARRFGVLGMLLCLGVCVLVALRRGGRIPDTARGPVARVLGIVFMSLLLMMFTPTKWTHHFGVYAGLAGALGAVTAVAVGKGIRARHHRSLVAAAVMFLLAFSFTGSNGWWYVSGYGMRWPDRSPELSGVGISTMLLGLAALCLLVAAWQYFREPYRTRRNASDTGFFDHFALRPLTVAAAALVAFQVVSLAAAAYAQYPAYSVALSNLRTLAGQPCAMADDVLVETNTADSLLQPYTGSAADGLAAENTGFTADGVGSLAPDGGPGGGGGGKGSGGGGGPSAGDTPNGGDNAPGGDEIPSGGDSPKDEKAPGGNNAPNGGNTSGGSGAPNGGNAPGGGDAPGSGGVPSGGDTPGGTEGGDKPSGPTPGGAGDKADAKPGINGSTVALPFGLDPTRTPVLGSYAKGAREPARLTTQWYRMDLAAAQQDPAYRVLILTAAGRIASTDDSGRAVEGQQLRVEFARRADDGTVTPLGDLVPPNVGGAPTWRNLPIALDRIPEGTNAIRLVAEADTPSEKQWLAVTPPRLPRLETLNTVVGNTAPVLTDFHVGLAFPCQRPFDHKDGVAELPSWRITADKLNGQVAQTWQGDTGGGPIGWSGLLVRSQTVPTYLDNDWTRDWGELQRLTPHVDAPHATVGVSVETRWGWEGDEPIMAG